MLDTSTSVSHFASMSTSEKQDPGPNAKCKIVSWNGVVKIMSFLTLATCSMALGFASTTRIASDDGLLKSTIKLLPVSGAAVRIHAVILHASLLRAVWHGQFPGDRRSHDWKFAVSGCYAVTLTGRRDLVDFQMSALCAPGGYHSLLGAFRRAREAGERARPLRAASVAMFPGRYDGRGVDAPRCNIILTHIARPKQILPLLRLQMRGPHRFPLQLHSLRICDVVL